MPDVFNNFITVAASIVVGASPFIVIGVFIATIVNYTRAAAWLISHMPKNVVLRRIIVSCFGLAMPVCECGNVPVARSFMQRGFSVGEATTFLLAAPTFNPITMYVTYEAFRSSSEVFYIRIIAALAIANIIGIIIGFLHAKKSTLTEEFDKECHVEHNPSNINSVGYFYTKELFTLFKLVAIGACIAAFVQTMLPPSVVISIAQDPIMAIVAMIALAFIISVCSSVDSFIALAYRHTFHTGAIVAFLVAGPLIDLKMLILLRQTYNNKALIVMTSLALFLSFITGVLVYYYV